MAEVTYLLGAGASVERIPTVDGMKDSIKGVISQLQNMVITQHNYYNPNKKLEETTLRHLPELVKDLEWMSENNDSHFSIDTFAKKLYLTQSSDLKKLKLILSFYFTYLQITGKPDKRYDNFWASILTRPERLPNKIKVLSWNYDFQLEQSYTNMSRQGSMSHSRDWINLLNYGGRTSSFHDAGFGVIKLNRSAEVCIPTNSGESVMFEEGLNQVYESSIEALIVKYSLYKSNDNVTTRLRFAWESTLSHLVNTVKPFVKNSEVVAIIGYSLPFFNREIDVEIFRMMEDLRVIYVQSAEPEAIRERLMELLDTPEKVKIKLIHDKRQFVFPKELELT